MTIRKGESWGETVRRPADLQLVDDDAAVADALTRGVEAVAVRAGDLSATVGARPVEGRDELLRLPLDLVQVRLDDGRQLTAVAHIVARETWWRGGAARGPVIVVMNAEFLGGLPVAPRGHPNDGRVEVMELDAATGFRQRVAIRGRAKSAAHLPHPSIATRSVRSGQWEFDRPMTVVIDGVRRGRSTSIEIEVLADRGVLYT